MNALCFVLEQDEGWADERARGSNDKKARRARPIVVFPFRVLKKELSPDRPTCYAISILFRKVVGEVYKM